MGNASQPLTKTECTYAERMKATLDLSHGCKKKNSFIYGTPLLAETDHKLCTAIAKTGLINILERREIAFSVTNVCFTNSVSLGEIWWLQANSQPFYRTSRH